MSNWMAGGIALTHAGGGGAAMPGMAGLSGHICPQGDGIFVIGLNKVITVYAIGNPFRPGWHPVPEASPL
jgi:hypothetical protein